ncbi:MAG: glycoside hydrolase family 38 [Phycisphaerae bacterium]|nr:glycoside hydrolase family 38 [Phycisphaerae bacterium]
MSTKKRIGHYVASTHWDREWYESFQDYRFRLVKLMDELLDTMQRDPDYRYFQLDGQVIPVEDYLEIRPEREGQLRELAAAGRLRLGPWYVLPDECLVSGESLVRNIQMGLEAAGRYATPSRVGFICDMFGHTSQLPQILRGFGIDTAFLWRGVNEPTHGAVFRWQAADGSEVIAYRFSPQGGYCTYAFKVRKGIEPDRGVDMETALEGLADLLEVETKRVPTPSFLVFDGGDHLEIEPRTAEILRAANKKFAGVELVHSHLEGFAEDLREQRDHITKVFKGELREPGLPNDEAWMIPGVLSSRIHLKQANARCENQLTLWAEPFSTFAALLSEGQVPPQKAEAPTPSRTAGKMPAPRELQAGRMPAPPYPAGFLRTAWKHLITNHPHDSMCGCSIDQVHKDMVYRFDQSYQIAAHVTRDALRHIADRVQVPELGEKDIALVVFNPGADPIDGPVDLTIRFPANIDAVYQEWFGFEPKIGFRLYDPEGKEVPYQYVNQRRDQMGFRRPLRKFPTPDPRHEVDITAELSIPPYGYTTLICRPVKEPTRYLGSMVVNDHTIENEALRVAVAPNGTLHVTDKRSGQTYENVLTLEDRADIGDGWYHGTAVNEQVYTSIASNADVAVVADGIAKATLMVRVTLNVPERFEFDRMVRSEQVKPLVVTHFVTLRKGSEKVEVRTVVENTIRDHRLRVLFPSGANASTYLADAAFDVIERPIALRADNARYKEMEVETKPQQTWTAVFDDQRGLAVVSTGLPESAVRDIPERPIALTLLRSFLRAVFTSGQEGGEIQGRHEFQYWIVPLAGSPDVARLTRMGQQLAGGTGMVQLERRDVDGGSDRPSPLRHSFMQVQPAGVVVTAIHRRSESEAASVRMFNPGNEPLEASLTMVGATGPAALTDLEGNPVELLRGQDETVRVNVPPRRIVTVQFGV